jgi:beta-N-acetylhexosaminidase
VRAMLAGTAQNQVSELAGDVLARHRGAGTQFDAATVEVV